MVLYIINDVNRYKVRCEINTINIIDMNAIIIMCVHKYLQLIIHLMLL